MVISEILERVDHIPSTVFEPEIRLWDKYLKDMEGVLLDVGTGWGKSAAALALISPNLSVQTIDIGTEYVNHERTLPEYIETVRENLKKAGVTNAYFQQIPYQEYTCPYRLQALNVDVTATYNDYLAVLERFLPSVVSGGLVFIHSYVHPKEDGPHRALDDHAQRLGLLYREIADPCYVGGDILQPALFVKL